MTPAAYLRSLRTRRGFTQAELGEIDRACQSHAPEIADLHPIEDDE